ncbi:Phosphopantetheine attachment site [Amycolatopsis pretoriensis]|uniref:Phosphopantetheine attachment site n=1 Tax=Amycolatopsis pretoriensis TaxID=218821 RepID=A0A1H5QFW2_9PSEU|nr:condensation domain-containing protein [Amycolatopsis pretoriensis]SEF24271.1 Phosphopantetheine attachment site [Amycolatopsis pretoriensis]
MGQDHTKQPTLSSVLEVASSLLGEPVAPGDNLFDLGATSLVAIKLANRLAVRHAVDLPPARVLRAQTPAAIAAVVDALPVREPAGTAEGRWEYGLPLSQFMAYRVASDDPRDDAHLLRRLYWLEGELDTGALAGALDVVTSWHDALRTRILAGPRPVVDPPGSVDPVCTVERGTAADARRFLRRDFDLATEIPIRARLTELGDRRFLLAISVHHTAYDGWSEQILLRDLATAYTALAAGEPPAERQPTSYHRAIAVQESRQAAGLRAARHYWRDQLAGATALPLGAARGGVGPGCTVPATLPGGRSATAAELLAAYAGALHDVTGARDVLVNVPVAGRSVPEVENVIGCFPWAAAVRFPDAGAPAGELVETAAERLRAVLASPPMPIGAFYRPPADVPRSPLLQATFEFHVYAVATLDLPGVRCTGRERLSSAETWHDVALEVWPEPEAHAELRYRTDVLSDGEARRLATAWTSRLQLRDVGVGAAAH